MAVTDTPLYCRCGTRLGFRRSDDAFVSRHTGRTYVLLRAFGDWGDGPEPDLEITCEQCALTKDCTMLLDKPPDKG